MNSINLHLENDPQRLDNQILKLEFSQDSDGYFCLNIHYEDLEGIVIQRDIQLSKETISALPKMLSLLKDCIKNEDW